MNIALPGCADFRNLNFEEASTAAASFALRPQGAAHPDAKIDYDKADAASAGMDVISSARRRAPTTKRVRADEFNFRSA